MKARSSQSAGQPLAPNCGGADSDRGVSPSETGNHLHFVAGVVGVFATLGDLCRAYGVTLKRLQADMRGNFHVSRSIVLVSCLPARQDIRASCCWAVKTCDDGAVQFIACFLNDVVPHRHVAEYLAERMRVRREVPADLELVVQSIPKGGAA